MEAENESPGVYVERVCVDLTRQKPNNHSPNDDRVKHTHSYLMLRNALFSFMGDCDCSRRTSNSCFASS